jgi:undecaprenyl-diphosphatase
VLEDLLKAAILGTVQGLTEFLPVSSTGHLILAEKVLHIDQDRYGLSFDVAIHMGTLLALLAYYGRRWVTLTEAGLRSLASRSLEDTEARLAWLIVAGTIPAAVLGLLFADWIEKQLRAPAVVAVMLIAFSAVFVVAERLGKRLRGMGQLRWADGLIIGLAQAVALVPGTSRSGATISAGLLRDIKREDAANFAFLLSAPIIAGAGLSKTPGVLKDFADGTLGGSDAAFFATGMVCAAVVGYVAIAFLLRFLRTNSLVPFVWYRVGLGVAVLVVLAVQAAS